MSWDVLLYAAGGTPDGLRELQEGEGADLPVMGDAAVLRGSITAVLPGVDWADPAWGRLEGAGFSIEFNIDGEGPVTGIMLHVRGNGDPLPSIVALCTANAWRALDTVTGTCLDLRAPSGKGWDEFRSYRDQVLDKPVREDE